MSHRPPPFSALRTLEAAARLRSYTAAAAELQVTHSAVSQAIRRLEDELGIKLFYRRGSFMEPAPSSLLLARAYHEAAQHLSRSLIDVAGRNAPDNLVISAPPGFARIWLAPRLPSLAAAFPGLNCDIRTNRELATLDGDGVDLAIRFGVGPWPPARAEQLFNLALFPVSSPTFAAAHSLGTPHDVAHAPLIEQTDSPWSAWFEAAWVEAPRHTGRATFDDEQMALEMAVAGQGVALTYAEAAAPYLADGRLVRVSDITAISHRNAWMLWREENPKLRLIRNFSWWIRGELSPAIADKESAA